MSLFYSTLAFGDAISTTSQVRVRVRVGLGLG